MDNNMLQNRNGADHGDGARITPPVSHIGAIYSIVVFVFLFLGSRVQKREFYTGIVITEFIIIALPVFIYLILFKYDTEKILRFNRTRILSLFITACIMVFAMPVVGVLNFLNLWVINTLFGRISIAEIPVGNNGGELLISILVIAGTAALCEEILFRGLIQKSLEKAGTVKALLITSFLFGLMHVDFQKLLGTFLLGGLIGYIVYKTDSIYAGITAHFTNNAVSVVLSYGVKKLTELMQESGLYQQPKNIDASSVFEIYKDLTTFELMAVISIWAFIFLFCLAVLAGLIIALSKTTAGRARPVRREEAEKLPLKEIAWFIPGIVFIALIYFSQGVRLAGYEIPVIDSILKFIGLR